MPNYAELAKKLLSADDLALTKKAGKPAIIGLGDADLYTLISDLERARDAAGQPGQGGEKTGWDILMAAVRRAEAERRARGLKPVKAAAPASRAAKPRKATGVPTAKPANRRTPGRPAGAKADKRTAPRRVVKPVAKNAAEPAETPKPAMARPKKAEPAVKVTDQRAAKKAKKEAEKAARKAARKAEKKARKKAEKKSGKSGKKGDKAKCKKKAN